MAAPRLPARTRQAELPKTSGRAAPSEAILAMPREVGAATADESDQDEAVEEPTVRRRRAPDAPSAAERALHNVLHEPFRPWCRSCVAGRARSDRHQTRDGDEKDIPVEP